MRRRRSRTRAFGPFASNPTSALMRLGTLLIVLGLIYSWASKPQSWRWLEDNAPGAADGQMALAEMGPSSGGPSTEGTPVAKPAVDETVVAAPTDVDPAEREQAQHLFEAVSDKPELAPEEMAAYWRLMKWTRAQTFAAMDHRAARDVPRLGLLEQPERYRGHLLRLRLHILRILDWEAPKNSADVKRVYEAWGWTDQSNSLYVCAFTELPAGMKTGESQHEEGVFVGYFLKDLGFQALMRNHAAPLLVGRMQRAESSAPAPLVAESDWHWLWMGALVFVAISFVFAWLRLRRVRPATVAAPTAADEAEMEDWFRSEGTADPIDPAHHRDL
jgi:hypothetical protein